MTDNPAEPERPARHDAEATVGAPRWVKLFSTIVIIAILLLVILLLTRGPGGHGPGRHLSVVEYRTSQR